MPTNGQTHINTSPEKSKGLPVSCHTCCGCWDEVGKGVYCRYDLSPALCGQRKYKEFLISKTNKISFNGIDVDENDINPILFPFQRVLTRWALKKGCCALFCDTGLGKSFMQLEWARLIAKTALIVAPLSVAKQTVREGAKLGIEVNYCRFQEQVKPGINITNYEMIEHFDAAAFGAVVLDESSILKSIDGKTKDKLLDMFVDTPYKLCCTATPAPNDIAEIANHSEFLGIMNRTEMLASYFVHDDDGWRLKGHAEEPFYKWMASWSMSVRKPSNIGFDDTGYNLPSLNIKPVFVKSEYKPDDQLFFTGLKGISDRSKVRKGTVAEKIMAVNNLITNGDQYIVWCGLNDESNALKKILPDNRNIEGADSADQKTKDIEDFQDGKYKVLITKPKIAGMGLNLQNCHKQIFMGLSDSYEALYQCIRRSYRFGQSKPVDVFIVLSEIEQDIYRNVLNKEKEAMRMSEQLIKNVSVYEIDELSSKTDEFVYSTATTQHEKYKIMLGDSVERLNEISDESVHLSVFSPPFQSLYVYSPTERDLGNSKNSNEFSEHFLFIVNHLLRVTMPGRVCAVHVADIPAMLVRDGYIGMKDFSGDIIKLFQSAGWIFDSRIPIDKNQQAQSIRTHSKSLTMTQMKKDRSWLRPALPDYILKFRKPGDNPIPVAGGMTGDEWIELANPTWPNETDRCAEWGAWATWYGIKESDTLNVAIARDNKDERHICPLQLETIERCIRLWSNEGETILDPFAGIGSTGYVALKMQRRFIGCELKPSYYKSALNNLSEINNAQTNTLF
jgi:DNA modification methylase